MRPRIELLLVCIGVSHLHAQGREVDFLYGRWYQGNESKTYELRLEDAPFGTFAHGLALQAIVHDSLGRRRAFYGGGWQAQLWRGRSMFGPYALAGASLGLATDTSRQNLAVLWSLGAGVEWRPASSLAVGLEGVYRVVDIGPRGFWRTSPEARDGVSAALGISLTVGTMGSRRRGGTPPRELPPLEVPRTITGNAADIVRTALDALGTPYVWGGTAANGFDCSGLVQWAYSQHGIRVPRMSRDQAQSGTVVPPVVEALHPGDILLFAAQPGGGVTHVGMYVGDGTFIHSANSGVKLSRLDVEDVEGAWWVARWVGARRIVQ